MGTGGALSAQWREWRRTGKRQPEGNSYSTIVGKSFMACRLKNSMQHWRGSFTDARFAELLNRVVVMVLGTLTTIMRPGGDAAFYVLGAMSDWDISRIRPIHYRWRLIIYGATTDE